MTEAELKRIIFDGLRKIAPESEPETLAADANVRKTLDIDSYDFLNFLIGLSEKLGVEVPEEDYGKIRSLKELFTYLSARVGQGVSR
ncbi:MAG: acyl carrier protein [Chthoniobacterales bacterium]